MDNQSKENRRNTMDSANSSSSTSSTRSRTSAKLKLALVRFSSIFSRSTTSSTLSTSPSNTFANRRSSKISSNSSVNTSPSSVASLDIMLPASPQGRKKKWIDRDSGISDITIPPFSPTYCKPNEFPYSNFYMKLPNGRWMIRYRSGTRHIIGTDEFAGFMI